MKDYHFCATCVNFDAKKAEKMVYICKRLGYNTLPKYKLNCWDPREDIKQLMNDEKSNT